MTKTREFQEIIPPTKITLAVRFKVGDLAYVKIIAEKNGKNLSTWIRELAFERAKKVLKNGPVVKLNPLSFSTAKGKGESVCIRLTEKGFLYLRRAAIVEGALVSPWIRACVTAEIEKKNE